MTVLVDKNSCTSKYAYRVFRDFISAYITVVDYS